MTVAGADIDGNALADNIIVGSGPGMESQIKVFSSTVPSESGKAPDVFSAFTPYPGSESGVTLATGMVESGSGRESIVTAPGPGRGAADEDVPVGPVHADRASAGQRHHTATAFGQAE